MIDASGAHDNDEISVMSYPVLPLHFPVNADFASHVLKNDDPAYVRMWTLMARCRSFPFDVFRVKQLESEFHYIERLSRHDGVAIDVGANVGYYAEPLSLHNSKVVAFEANPFLIPYLTINMMRRGNVFILPFAAGNKHGLDHFMVPVVGADDYISHSGSGGLKNEFLSSASIRTIDTPAFVIPVDALRLDNISVLKVDVEGTEIDALLGAAETIARSRPNVMFENELRHNSKAGYIFQYMQSIGYQGFFHDRNDGMLRPMENFSFERYQQTDQNGNILDPARYVNNFIYVPAERANPLVAG